jgi:hypothetical protein
MKLSWLIAAFTLSAAVLLLFSAAAAADSPASDAAQGCLQGPQYAFYAVSGDDGASTPAADSASAPPLIDFGGLAHGSNDLGDYVVAADHGDCVSFIAKNSKGKGGKGGAAAPFIVFKFSLVALKEG